VALGDSLTSGQGIGADWPIRPSAAALDAAGLEYTVVNAGVPGDTSTGALRRFERALDGDVRILIVALGAMMVLRGVPVERLKRKPEPHHRDRAGARIVVLLCGWRRCRFMVGLQRPHSTTRIAISRRGTTVPLRAVHPLQRDRQFGADAARSRASQCRRPACDSDKIWPYLEPLIIQPATRADGCARFSFMANGYG